MIRIILYFITFVIITALSVFFKHTLGEVRFTLETVSYELPTVLLIWANILFLFAVYIIYMALRFFKFVIKLPFVSYGIIKSNDKDLYIKDVICDIYLGNNVNSADILKKLSKNSSDLAKVLKAIVLFNEGKFDDAHEILFTVSSYTNTTLHNLKRICYYKSSANTSKNMELDYFLTQIHLNDKVADILIEQLIKENNKTALASVYHKTSYTDKYVHMQMENVKDLMEADETAKALKILDKIIKEYPQNVEALSIFNDLCVQTNQQKKVFKAIKHSWNIHPSHELADLFIKIFQDDTKNIGKYMNDLTHNNPEDPESIILKAKLGLKLQVWNITAESLKIEPNRDLTLDESRHIAIMKADLLEFKDKDPNQANLKRLEIINSL